MKIHYKNKEIDTIEIEYLIINTIIGINHQVFKTNKTFLYPNQIKKVYKEIAQSKSLNSELYNYYLSYFLNENKNSKINTLEISHHEYKELKHYIKNRNKILKEQKLLERTINPPKITNSILGLQGIDKL